MKMSIVFVATASVLSFAAIARAAEPSAPTSPTPAAVSAASAPVSSILHKKVTVVGTNDEWTPTDIKVQSGDLLILLVTGKVKFGGFVGERSADGSVGEAHDKNYGLEMKAGSAGKSFLTADRFVWVADSTGPIKLRARDTNWRDNSGSFEVELIQIPAGSIPPAQTVASE